MAIIVLFHALIAVVSICILFYGAALHGKIEKVIILLAGFLLAAIDAYSFLAVIEALKR